MNGAIRRVVPSMFQIHSWILEAEVKTGTESD
jgi:hypothetical protein